MKKVFIIFSLFSLILVYSCDKNDGDSIIQEPIITSYVKVDSVFSSKVMFGGEIIELPKDAVDHGFVFGLTTLPDIEIDSVISLGKPDFSGDFFEIKSGLKPGFNYYMRAYIETNNEIYYGSSIEFSITLIKNISPEGSGKLDTITM